MNMRALNVMMYAFLLRVDFTRHLASKLSSEVIAFKSEEVITARTLCLKVYPEGRKCYSQKYNATLGSSCEYYDLFDLLHLAIREQWIGYGNVFTASAPTLQNPYQPRFISKELF